MKKQLGSANYPIIIVNPYDNAVRYGYVSGDDFVDCNSHRKFETKSGKLGYEVIDVILKALNKLEHTRAAGTSNK